MKRSLTIRQAAKIATERYGKGAYVERNPDALVGEALADVRQALKTHRSLKPIDTRTKDASDAEKLAYLALWRPWHQREQSLMDAALARRCRVLSLHDVGGVRFASVRGEGDTFEEALEAAARRFP